MLIYLRVYIDIHAHAFYVYKYIHTHTDICIYSTHMFVDTIYAHICYIDCAVSIKRPPMLNDVQSICYHKQVEYHVDDTQC